MLARISLEDQARFGVGDFPEDESGVGDVGQGGKLVVGGWREALIRKFGR